MNQREVDVLNILWGSEIPLSLTDILNINPDLVKSTVAAILAKLLKEQLIEVAGITYSGKVLCRTYRPTAISKEKIVSSLTENYNKVSNIIPQSTFVASILRLNRDKEKAKKEIAQLRAMLDEFEKENNIQSVNEEKESC